MSSSVTQLVIDLPHRPARGRRDFLVSGCNAAALGWIDRWPDWPDGVLSIHGPAGCGKTHLAHVWRERTAALLLDGGSLTGAEPVLTAAIAAAAVAVDDADRAPEVPLLHLYNLCRERRVPLLILAPAAPPLWPIALPDLASRLRAAASIGIDRPDDALLGAILVKHFADRQLRIMPEVVAYVVPRMERSFAAAAALAAALDRAALSGGRSVTVPLARRVLAEGGQSSSDLGVT